MHPYLPSLRRRNHGVSWRKSGAIPDAIWRKSGAIPDAISAQNGQIAQMVLGSKTATKDGRRAYNQGYPEEFEVFWKVFPMRKSKRKALIAWRNSIRRIGANPVDAMAQIKDGAKRYAEEVGRTDVKIKYAEGWLNDARWEDEPAPPRDPYEAEQARIRDKKIAEAHRMIEEERRVRRQEQS